jgi:hypothetical protein
MNNLTNRVFKIWSYAVSHSFLILRYPMIPFDLKGSDDSNNFNIDIEFASVANIDIHNAFVISSIIQFTNNSPSKFEKHTIALGYKLFQINSNQNKYFIIASSDRALKDRWLNEDRILNTTLEYDEIFAIS